MVVTSGSTYDTFITYANSNTTNIATVIPTPAVVTTGSTTLVGVSNALNLVTATNGKFPFPLLS